MNQNEYFIIEYLLHEKPQKFILRAQEMSNADAWHWASCDAGASPLPRPGKPPLKKFSKPMAERCGITDVRWRESVSVTWEEVSS